MHKFDGERVRPLTPSEARQIAGRAGRYRSRHDAGEVTCLHAADMPELRRSLAAPLAPLEQAGLSPTYDQLQLLHRAYGGKLPYSALLGTFEEAARLDRQYFCCNRHM